MESNKVFFFVAHLISTYLMDILQWSSQTLTSWQTQDSSFWLVMEIYNGGSVRVLATSWKLQTTVLEAKEEQIFNQHGSTFSSNFRCFQPKRSLSHNSIQYPCILFNIYLHEWLVFIWDQFVGVSPTVRPWGGDLLGEILKHNLKRDEETHRVFKHRFFQYRKTYEWSLILFAWYGCI